MNTGYSVRPNEQGKRRRSTEGAQGTNKGHENAEGMAFVGVRLTVQLGWWLVLDWMSSLCKPLNQAFAGREDRGAMQQDYRLDFLCRLSFPLVRTVGHSGLRWQVISL